eukprot:12909091-Prorocentrum_lima.AAC.1
MQRWPNLWKKLWEPNEEGPIMTALVALAKKKVVPYATTRYNIIPDNDQEMATTRSGLLGAYTIRGRGITRQ